MQLERQHEDLTKTFRKKNRVFAYGLAFAVIFHGILLGLFYGVMLRLEKEARTKNEAIPIGLELVEEPHHRKAIARHQANNDEVPEKARFLSEKASIAQQDVSPSANIKARSKPLAPASRSQAEKAFDRKGEIPTSKKLAKKNDPLGLFNPAINLSEEHVVGTKEGRETALSAWQYQHAPFFNRIKERIGALWNPTQAIRRNDPEGKLLGQMDRVTGVQVTIDQQGSIVDVSITRESGVDYLDAEALRATKLSGPYINPPLALFKGQQYFVFDFGFYLSVSRGFSFDFDW